MTREYQVGDRVSFTNQLCTVRYIGPVGSTTGQWLGVEWDDTQRGKHNGTYDGHEYFKCLSPARTAASFVRPSKPADPERSFVEAVRQKYAAGITSQQPLQVPLDMKIVISGKVAEEVGFEKVREQQAQLHELKIVIIDGMHVSFAEKKDEEIGQTCPKIVELDLSRNLFSRFNEVHGICCKLRHLKKLRLNGNRFSHVDSSWPEDQASINARSLLGIVDLELDQVLLPWNLIVSLCRYFPSLATLSASSNQLHALPCSFCNENIVALSLQYNKFTSLSELIALRQLKSLQTLRLMGNQISILTNCGEIPEFGVSLKYVDLSYNAVGSWDFIDHLPMVFPGLSALRISQNPIYENVAQGRADSVSRNDEGYLTTIARLANLKTLNFSNITPAERTNAEIYYLSQIGKEIAAVPEESQKTVIARHRRYSELCRKYGSPTLTLMPKRGSSGDTGFLEARLIEFEFKHVPLSRTDGLAAETETEKKLRREIPQSFDVYRVKSIVGRMFHLPPLDLRLVWETGEWDPVAAYEDQESESESGGDEERDGSREKEEKENGKEREREKGSWLPREIEIVDSTRRIGNFIEGLRASVRVELVL